METHLDGRMMDRPRRIRRTLVNIVAQTGATTCAEVAAHGLAAQSASCSVLLGSNFHSSHSPRPATPSLAPPPEPRWKSPTTCSLQRRRVGWIGSSGRGAEERGGGKRGGSPVAKAPPPPAATTAALPDSQGRGTGEGRKRRAGREGPRQGKPEARGCSFKGGRRLGRAGQDEGLGGPLPPSRPPPARWHSGG